MKGWLERLVLLAALLGLALPGQAQDAAVERSIEQVAGNVYRFRSDNHYGVFLVTDAGVIVADPLSTETAAWLKQELRQRFAQDVKYVIYSHDHWDHATGAAEFEGATIIAHANAVPHIAAATAAIAPPDITFSSELDLRLGQGSVHLYYLGENHSDNLIFMVFPEERVLFAVDAVAVDTLPFQNFPDTDIDGLIGALTALEQMDVDVVVPGHGAMGTLADLRAHREYLEDLKDQVTALLRAGNADAVIKSRVDLSRYQQWNAYEQWREANIEGMIAYVKSHYSF
ncbi:MAG TPA: MBL fold metallo-hydrolase [Hyphomicrobiales bacterium]|nr:MBL fold metallo-hydrolase [Hyphomicrobiales bacterium]